MQRIPHLLFILSLALGLSAQQKKNTAAVLNFVNSGGVDKNEITILTNRFSNYLVNAGVYKILEREKMDAILKEQDFSLTDNCNAAECAVQIGQLLGVDLMVTGNVGQFGQVWTVDTRVVDVSTGEILKTQSENYKGEKEGLLTTIESLAYAVSDNSVQIRTAKTGPGDEIKIGNVTKKYGSLEINNELDGMLYIDDRKIGEVSQGSVIPIENLKPGEHNVKISYLQGDFIKRVTIKYGQKEIITAIADIGTLEIDNHINGTLFIDDKQITEVLEGSTIVESLKSGGHTIKIIHPDGQFVRKINIVYNQTTRLVAEKDVFFDSRDGKKYKIATIGNQVWMTQNLNYDVGRGSYCYENKQSICGEYGRLYTWEAAMKAIPPGWHLPSKSEWSSLWIVFGGSDSAVYRQLTAGGDGGFAALFGGWRNNKGKFEYSGKNAYFWSSTKADENTVWRYDLYSSTKTAVINSYNQNFGLSVRCIKD